MNCETEPQWLTSGEASRLLDRDVNTVKAWARSGHIRYAKTVGGWWMFVASDVEAMRLKPVVDSLIASAG